MKDTEWVLIDTETTGFTSPIFVVEIGAQKMRGWQPIGAPFRRLLNQNLDIPPQAARVHGYTREILERDGDPAALVYRDFAKYAGGLPIVAYNLDYDFRDVLLPEWKRLGIAPVGPAGFCAMRLAQRLLDPIPAGNCKLQTLRQYYRLPERGAHTALGDVNTVCDLMSNVLREIAEQRGLKTWSAICNYAKALWFPSRISFGKFKGRLFRDAHTDPALHGWLTWLASSANKRSAQMGRWYLGQLERADVRETLVTVAPSHVEASSSGPKATQFGITLFVDPQMAQLLELIATSRAKLAELEVSYTQDRRAVDLTQASIFKLVRVHYQARDRLKLIIDYRSKYLKALIRQGEEEAAQVAEAYADARAQSDANYEEAAAEAESHKALSDEEALELKALWKKLVRLYHPDRFVNQPEKLETYQRLTAAINKARDAGDIDVLRQIANDPQGFILRQGWATLDFSDAAELTHLRRLLDTLQIDIIALMELLNQLHESAEYELYRLSVTTPDILAEVASDQAKAIAAEIITLEAKAEKLAAAILELTGEPAPVQ